MNSMRMCGWPATIKHRPSHARAPWHTQMVIMLIGQRQLRTSQTLGLAAYVREESKSGDEKSRNDW
jgi:hypothetical protein